MTPITETYEFYHSIFIIGAILAGVFLLLAILLFFLLKIPQVIGILSGSTARKAIQKLREQNEHADDKVQGPGHNVTTGELGTGIGTRVRKISGAKRRAAETVVLDPADETVVLSGGDETVVLSGGDETTVLGSAGDTAQLSQPMGYVPAAAAAAPQPVYAGNFSVEYEITLIHTAEIIR